MLIRPEEDYKLLTLILESKRNKIPFIRGKVQGEKSEDLYYIISVDLKPGKFIFKYKLGERIFIDKQESVVSVSHREDLYHAFEVIDPLEKPKSKRTQIIVECPYNLVN